MPLDPQAQAWCDAIAALGDTAPGDERLQEIRDGYAALVTMMAGPEAAVFAVDDADADGVPVRIYRPAPDPGLPVIVYFHGGGWTIGTVDQYDRVTRQVANTAHAIVVSVDYRLAPEHRFPAAADDAWTALVWVAEHAATFGADPSRLAVMGDSAGGNLAAVCALRARDAGTPEIAMQVLVYPVTDCDFGTASYRENGTGYFLTEADMRWFFACYVPDETRRHDWRVSPLRAADVRGVAPTVVVTAEFDPLRDEGRAYATVLQSAGVPVVEHRYDGMIHGFFGMSAAFDASRDALDRISEDLSQAFGTLPH